MLNLIYPQDIGFHALLQLCPDSFQILLEMIGAMGSTNQLPFQYLAELQVLEISRNQEDRQGEVTH